MRDRADDTAPPTFDLASAPGHLIRRAAQLHTATWAELVDVNLTSVQFAILAALAATPDLDQRTLARRVSLDPATLADVSRRLVERGLVERARDAGDRRRNVLRLTDEGARVLRDAIPAVEKVGERLLDRFTAG